MELNLKEKISYGVGAVGKDMVYMLTATFVLYYYQDLLHINALAMGIILLVARVFDALNDPFMGIIVAKTKTRWGRFRPWLFTGSLLNALCLYLLFSAPSIKGAGLIAWAGVIYILWGVTYTMMDIPFWSMIPAFTKAGKEREGISALGRSCAGVGSALVQVFTMMAVYALGKGNEVAGFRLVALLIGIIFVLFISMTCFSIKEKSTVDMPTSTIKDMLKSLFNNDQALIIVLTIVLVNVSVYITSNLVIYFFKYDLGGKSWYYNFTSFNTFGGATQILSMMLLFPLMRKFFNTIKIFHIALWMAIVGYITLFVITFMPMNIYILFVPAFFIFAANGMLLVLTTIFLANTVDYGEYKNKRRDESVIFSMQTFVVKLASGVAALVAAICLAVFSFGSSSETGHIVKMSYQSLVGLRMTMTIIPLIGLVVANVLFKKRYKLDDNYMKTIINEIEEKKHD
ncbi:glycoside-pentoside-hexuronide (GPH):cation symporter [Kandleria vitulina]|uniref:glycoside-pentoside-hexuronide (GPH):cation symporter n=1 Tax=Kandleria vitulina TaxID=1630 RepID=UPI000491A0B5|nr:glycoside-pentoside-hexuronide (GPH):cation symporter [Kandleria vitulina]